MAEESTPEEGAKEGEEKGKGPKKKLPLLLIALAGQLVVVLAAGGFLVKTALFTKGPDVSAPKMKERAIASIEESIEKVQTMELEQFSVNLSGQKVLRTNIQLEVTDEATVAILRKRMSSVKARVLEVLAAQRTVSANTFQGKLRLKDAIRDALNAELYSAGEKKGTVREVYFAEFILI